MVTSSTTRHKIVEEEHPLKQGLKHFLSASDTPVNVC